MSGPGAETKLMAEVLAQQHRRLNEIPTLERREARGAGLWAAPLRPSSRAAQRVI
jgi:hypothetical protein